MEPTCPLRQVLWYDPCLRSTSAEMKGDLKRTAEVCFVGGVIAADAVAALAVAEARAADGTCSQRAARCSQWHLLRNEPFALRPEAVLYCTPLRLRSIRSRVSNKTSCAFRSASMTIERHIRCGPSKSTGRTRKLLNLMSYVRVSMIGR